MIWELIVIGIVFVITGICILLFIVRFSKWWFKVAINIQVKFPWSEFSGMSREEAEYQYFETQPYKGFYRFWLWGMRIMGMISIAVGFFSMVNGIFF